MYLPDSPARQKSNRALALLENATLSPAQVCADDPEIQAAFEEGLRELAEDIVNFHPGLAHLLLGMSESPCPVINGQN